MEITQANKLSFIIKSYFNLTKTIKLYFQSLKRRWKDVEEFNFSFGGMHCAKKKQKHYCSKYAIQTKCYRQ